MNAAKQQEMIDKKLKEKFCGEDAACSGSGTCKEDSSKKIVKSYYCECDVNKNATGKLCEINSLVANKLREFVLKSCLDLGDPKDDDPEKKQKMDLLTDLAKMS